MGLFNNMTAQMQIKYLHVLDAYVHCNNFHLSECYKFCFIIFDSLFKKISQMTQEMLLYLLPCPIQTNSLQELSL